MLKDIWRNERSGIERKMERWDKKREKGGKEQKIGDKKEETVNDFSQNLPWTKAELGAIHLGLERCEELKNARFTPINYINIFFLSSIIICVLAKIRLKSGITQRFVVLELNVIFQL